jgi:hypothetical protein
MASDNHCIAGIQLSINHVQSAGVGDTVPFPVHKLKARPPRLVNLYSVPCFGLLERPETNMVC